MGEPHPDCQMPCCVKLRHARPTPSQADRCFLCGRPFGRSSQPKWVIELGTYAVLGQAHTSCFTKEHWVQSTKVETTLASRIAQLYEWTWNHEPVDYASDGGLARSLVYGTMTTEELNGELSAENEERLRWWFERPKDPLPPERGPSIRAAYRDLIAQFAREVPPPGASMEGFTERTEQALAQPSDSWEPTTAAEIREQSEEPS